MGGLCNKVSDPLKVQHRLACIVGNIIWTYIHIFMCYAGNKILICQLQNAKSNFQNFCKIYARQLQKTNLIHLHIYLVEAIALILHSKVVFKKIFWLKLFILKNTRNTIPRGNKRSHILKYILLLVAGLVKQVWTFLPPCIKG